MKISRKGFTLAELLIVVAIIAVLWLLQYLFRKSVGKSREAADLDKCTRCLCERC